jgi:hypothetical protein
MRACRRVIRRACSNRRSQYGYTDKPELALFSEPEAVSREDQMWLTERARRTAHQAQVQEWAERRSNIAREIDWLYSQRFRRDVMAQLHQLQKQLERIDAKIAG